MSLCKSFSPDSPVSSIGILKKDEVAMKLDREHIAFNHRVRGPLHVEIEGRKGAYKIQALAAKSAVGKLSEALKWSRSIEPVRAMFSKGHLSQTERLNGPKNQPGELSRTERLD
jgi:hypothetical protein